jgi:hypothetical protein
VQTAALAPPPGPKAQHEEAAPDLSPLLGSWQTNFSYFQPSKMRHRTFHLGLKLEIVADAPVAYVKRRWNPSSSASHGWKEVPYEIRDNQIIVDYDNVYITGNLEKGSVSARMKDRNKEEAMSRAE